MINATAAASTQRTATVPTAPAAGTFNVVENKSGRIVFQDATGQFWGFDTTKQTTYKVNAVPTIVYEEANG